MTKAAKIGRTEVEDPDAKALRFENIMRRVLRISKDELNKREAEYQKSREGKRKPGPPKSS
jgi:hypothetical protein